MAVENVHPTKRKPSDKDALAIEAARLHFEDELEHPEVATRLGINAGEVAGLLRRARRKGLIALRVENPTVPRIDTMAGRMLETASGVRRVVAVRTTPNGSRLPTTAGDDPPTSPDRALHGQLAAGAAQFLWDTIRDRDYIAVGAGRAVRFTIDALGVQATSRPRSFVGLDILSLTGTPAVRRDPHDLDSDAIASELGHVLDVDWGRIRRVNVPYVSKNVRSALRLAGSLLMDPDWRRDRVPDVAVVGLGVLDSRHHLLASSRTDQMLAPVRATLDRLENEVLPACSTAIMDVYDTFWVRDGALEPELAVIARQLVADLNSKIVAVPRLKLNHTREKVVVAGGEVKYPGILAYLRQCDDIGLRPTVLVTDAATATRLVNDLSMEHTGRL